MTKRFDVTADLARRTLIEASAGTGKTYALCGLVAHLIGSGKAAINDFLVVTFTNLATDDLKNRIRQRLVSVRDALAHGDEAGVDDAVITALMDDDQARTRLDAALSDLGDLAVSTIHGFTQRALSTLGESIGVDPDRPLGPDDDFDGVAADALASLAASLDRANDDAAPPLPNQEDIKKLANLITSIPDLAARPDVAAMTYAELNHKLATEEWPDDTAATTRAAWVALKAIANARHRRNEQGVRNFDDLIADLHGVVTGPQGPEAQQLLRAKHRFVFIDEFQATDRTPWEIFDRCFGTDAPDDHSRLVLVGDPKQAIYRFRGADVHVYAHVAGRGDVDKRLLSVNYRSDAALLRGLETLFTGVSFGPEADFTLVEAAPQHEAARIRWKDAEPLPALRIEIPDLADSKTKAPGAKEAAAWIGRLCDEAEIQCHEEGQDTWQPVRPSDIAVLVRSAYQGAELQGALRSADIASVIHADDDVRYESTTSWNQTGEHTLSDAAWEWRVLLNALERPSDPRRARAAAAGIFGPMRTAGDDAGPFNDAVIASFQQRLAVWEKVLNRSGSAELVACLRNETDWVRRATLREDRGRLLTDLGHVGELLITLGGGPTSPDRLIEALSTSFTDDGDKQIPARRLESDEPAVTIMTIHKSKGLEFPIVGCLGLDTRKKVEFARHHEQGDGATPDREVLDLSLAPSADELAAAEAQEEELRLLYVALTRAKHHVFTGWKPQPNKSAGALSQVLALQSATDGADDASTANAKPARADQMGDDDGSTEDETTSTVAILRTLTERSRDGDGGTPTLAFVPVEPDGAAEATRSHGPKAKDPKGSTVDIEAPHALRPIDRRYRRWSFTAITAAARVDDHDDDRLVGSGADEGAQDDSAETPLSEDHDATVKQPLEFLVRGPRFGTFVHAVLEEVDFRADDLAAAVGDAVDRRLTGSSLDLLANRGRTPSGKSGRDLLVDGLVLAISSPLGLDRSDAGLADRSLRDLDWADRLSECDFDLRIDTESGGSNAAKRIAEVLVDPVDGLDPDDPYRPWAQALRDDGFDLDLSGHLTGSLDLVFRAVGLDDTPHFFVADYKTNALASYEPDALIAEMVKDDYPLQALLYSVALHRYLRWRLAGYDPAKHLGGALYLFLRGMNGDVPATGGPAPGVVHWRIPPRVIERVDALFSSAPPALLHEGGYGTALEGS